MSDEDVHESDRAGDAPHPRQTSHLFGQDAAEDTLLTAVNSGRLHHAWLVTGPKGIGKATFAWRAARFLLTETPTEGGLFGEAEKATSLDVDPEHPVSRRIGALSEPGLMLIRRAWDSDRKRFKAQISVDDVRKLGSFFGLSASEGSRRVVIVDSVDDMNPSAANALLKVLEEPPKDAILFLISHAPARLLPTIRSRCRELQLSPLEPEALSRALRQAGAEEDSSEALAALAAGSVGEAMRLMGEGGPAIYQDLLKVIATAPSLDRSAARSFADKSAARGAEDRLDLTVRLLDFALARAARTGAGAPLHAEAAPGETETLRRLAPSAAYARKWADLAGTLSSRISHGRAVNVDPASLLMDAFLQVNETAPRS